MSYQANRNRHGGYGIVGVFGTVAFFVFIVYLLLKVAAIYYDVFVIHKEVQHLSEAFKGRSGEDMADYLKRQLEVNGIDSVKPEDIHITYDSGSQAYSVNVLAEERVHVVHKLFFLIQIDESVEVPKE